jgi:hypothetical protein
MDTVDASSIRVKAIDPANRQGLYADNPTLHWEIRANFRSGSHLSDDAWSLGATTDRATAEDWAEEWRVLAALS